jgi:NADH:ubiquinone oxidoreductase subunit K
MLFSFYLNQFLINPTVMFLMTQLYFFMLIFLVLGALFGEFAEKRILAFFIYFELTHLLCVLLLISWGLVYGTGLIELTTAALFIIGSSGSETGIALALFMRYFRLTGRTVFFTVKDQKQPFVAHTILNIKA